MELYQDAETKQSDELSKILTDKPFGEHDIISTE